MNAHIRNANTNLSAYANDLDRAVAAVFQTMLSTACVPRACPPNTDCEALVARVEFGPPQSGSCRLHLDQRSAAAFCSAIAGNESAKDADLVDDAARELCNMIAGGWKSMQDQAHGAMTPPVLERGVAQPLRAADLRCYTADACHFCVELAVTDVQT